MKKATLTTVSVASIALLIGMNLAANAGKPDPGKGAKSEGDKKTAEHVIPTAPPDYIDKKNPLNITDKSVTDAGMKIYERKCKRCHGAQGDGKGSSAKDLNPPVTSFSEKGYLAGRKDGQLYWVIDKGIAKTDMDGFGPESHTNFSEEDIWKIISYMRSKFTK